METNERSYVCFLNGAFDETGLFNVTAETVKSLYKAYYCEDFEYYRFLRTGFPA